MVFIIKNRKARRTALTGVHTAQTYGHTSVGMSPTQVDSCKSNVAEAIGLMGAGACATTAIKWSFVRGRFANSSADPRVTMPYTQIKAWIGLWRRSCKSIRTILRKTWQKLYRKLAKAKSRWQMVRGPASATISTLLDLGWKPVHPDSWITDSGLEWARFDAVEGVTHHHVLHVIEQQLTQRLWCHAAGAHCGKDWNTASPTSGR